MKRILLISLFTLIGFISNAQLDSTALLIIDIQNFYFPGGNAPLVEPGKAAQQAKVLLDFFRKNDGLVVYVKHNYEPGGDIYALLKPQPNEKIFTKNDVNAFLGTGLNDYLQKNLIKNVVLCGMQTHMCLEGATRAAHDLGYKCTVVEDACATRDLTYNGITIKARDVHYSTLATLKSYGIVTNLETFLKNHK